MTVDLFMTFNSITLLPGTKHLIIEDLMLVSQYFVVACVAE
jgi:hypothetical protein